MNEEPSRPLDEIRVDIDALDAELVRLLSRRAELAQEVGRTKGKSGAPFFTPERERAIFEKLRETNPGPLRTEQIQAVFREIISAARALEKPMTVAYWGPPGTFTHLAALRTFGSSCEHRPCDSIPAVFEAVERGEADYGVVPVENSLAGAVPQTLDQLSKTTVRICAETFVPIHHHLVSTAKSLRDVERVYAFEQPASQCRTWLRSNLPNAEIVDAAPTAKAAQRALMDPEGSAICNSLAAEVVGIPILAERIEDNPNNRTRFYVLGFQEPARTGRDKTTVQFKVRNQPGDLVRALACFQDAGVNITMIESRPDARSTFEYLFYCDLDGHRTDAEMKNALETLSRHALQILVLGSYPRREM